MNIQSILMTSSHERESFSTTKESSPSDNSVTSTAFKAQFWETSASNVFLPNSTDTNNNNNNGQETGATTSNNIPNFVDLSVDQNMICPLCKKVFRFEKNLLRHMQKTHATGEAESVLKCKLCNYTTRHYSNMYVHIRTHTGDKPYSCSGCGASFTQGSSLKLHIKSRHEDNTTLFSLTKKPGKNNLTKLWTRVYKKDLTKFANYGLGNYFSSFTLPNMPNHSQHDFLLPFPNFLPYSRVPQLPSLTRGPPSLSHFGSGSHNLPLMINRFPFLPSMARSDSTDIGNPRPTNIGQYHSTINPVVAQPSRAKKAILSISNFVNDDEKSDSKASERKDREELQQHGKITTNTDFEEYEENMSEILSVTDIENEEVIEKSVQFPDPLSDLIKSYLLKGNHSNNPEQLFKLLQTLGPNVLQILKSMSSKRLPNDMVQFPKNTPLPSLLNTSDSSREFYNRSMGMSRNNLFSIPLNKAPPHQSMLNPMTGQSITTWNDMFSKMTDMSDNILLQSQTTNSVISVPGRGNLPQSSASVMFGLAGYQPLLRMMDKASNQFLP